MYFATNSLWLLFVTFFTVYGISDEPILIVVSYDAFRFDYINRNITPYMSFLKKHASYADYVQNVFPTKTFPNHHTMATGVYPYVHGVIGNRFYDPEIKKNVSIRDPYNMYRYNHEALPIWVCIRPIYN